MLVGVVAAIPSLERLRQEVCSKSEASLGYKVSSGPACPADKTLSKKTKLKTICESSHMSTIMGHHGSSACTACGPFQDTVRALKSHTLAFISGSVISR